MAKAKQDRPKNGLQSELNLKSANGDILRRAETAAYISDITIQLRDMARAADLKFLAYFLEMAFHEAFTQSSRKKEIDRKN